MKRTLRLIPGLPTKKLLAAIREHLRGGDAERRALAFYLGEMETRREYQSVGHPSTVHYAEKDLGLKRREARELVRIGRALDGLKEISRAFDAGGIGWSGCCPGGERLAKGGGRCACFLPPKGGLLPSVRTVPWCLPAMGGFARGELPAMTPFAGGKLPAMTGFPRVERVSSEK